PTDHFDVVEIQKPFYDIIQQKFSASNIDVHFADILEFESDRKYDYIFSSLPYENMKHQENRSIWEKKLSLCTPHSYICYFKYVNFGKFKSNFEKKLVKTYSHNKK